MIFQKDTVKITLGVPFMTYFSENGTNFTNIFQRLITPMEGFWPSKNQPMYGNQRFLYLAFFRRTYQINPLDASYQNSLCWGEYHIWKFLSNCPWSKIKLYHFVFYTLECVHVFCLFVDSIWLQHWTSASWGSTLGMCSLTLLLSAAESLQYQQVPFTGCFS